MNRERRRSSIHDITSINNGEVSSHQTPIIGQQLNTNTPITVPTRMRGSVSVKHRVQYHMPGLDMYGAPIRHMASAIGTPVALPPGPPPPPPPYVFPVAYPMAMHQ